MKEPKPSLLVLDIETAPAEAYIWRMWDETIGMDQLIKPSRIISVGAKFVGSSTFYYRDEQDGNKAMLQMAADLIARADAIITYNGDRFDLPKLKGEMLLYKVKLPPPTASIDVIKTVKKLGLQSNKLAFAVQHFKLGSKGRTDFRLWRKWVEGDPVARKKMQFYNRRDVVKLERLYKMVLPAMTSHPTLFAGTPGKCPVCGGKARPHGHRYTKYFQIQRIECMGKCKSWTDGKRTKR